MSKRKNEHVISAAQRESMNREFEILRANAALIIEHQEMILARKKYFFVPLSFAGYSIAYVVGSGPLCLGHLLLGWQDGILIEPCSKCGNSVRVTAFGGSPLSGSTVWSGFCLTCNKKIDGRSSVHTPFSKKVKFVMEVLKAHPIKTGGWVEVEGKKFSWGGNGLEKAKKRVWREAPTAKPIALLDLLSDLKLQKLCAEDDQAYF